MCFLFINLFLLFITIPDDSSSLSQPTIASYDPNIKRVEKSQTIWVTNYMIWVSITIAFGFCGNLQ